MCVDFNWCCHLNQVPKIWRSLGNKLSQKDVILKPRLVTQLTTFVLKEVWNHLWNNLCTLFSSETSELYNKTKAKMFFYFYLLILWLPYVLPINTYLYFTKQPVSPIYPSLQLWQITTQIRFVLSQLKLFLRKKTLFTLSNK